MQTRKNKQRNGTRKLPMYASTYDGVFYWYNKMFEKLGWMVLAKDKGNKEKISHYKHSIDRFLKTAEHIYKEYENHNRKHDVNVLLMNARALQSFVNKHF